VPLIGMLREAQAYVRCVERGLTIFDPPSTQAQTDLEQWQPILQWLGPLLDAPAPRPTPAQRPATPARTATMVTATAMPAPPASTRATKHAPTGQRRWFGWAWPLPMMPKLKR